MWEIKDIDPAGNPANPGRVFVTDGKEAFHVDAMGAERLVELLNAGAPKKKASK